ncbi:MAG: HU family DNA-binding protein [Planctomycetota bacterium]|jgi:integration host factor subunit beta
MATTKRELVKRIAKITGQKQDVTKEIIQTFLDQIIDELADGNRLEFREFGVFDIVHKKPRIARNPRTGATVSVPAKRMVHFKVGRLMKMRVMEKDGSGDTQDVQSDADTMSEAPAVPTSSPEVTASSDNPLSDD